MGSTEEQKWYCKQWEEVTRWLKDKDRQTLSVRYYSSQEGEQTQTETFQKTENGEIFNIFLGCDDNANPLCHPVGAYLPNLNVFIILEDPTKRWTRFIPISDEISLLVIGQMTEEFSEELTAQIERIIEEGENDYPAEEAAREIEKNNYHTRFPKYYSYSEWAMRNFPIQYYNEKLLLKELVSDITSSISFLLYSMYSEYLKNKEGVIAGFATHVVCLGSEAYNDASDG